MATTSTTTSPEQSGHGDKGHPSLGLYAIVYVSLLVLTSITFVASMYTPESAHMPVALAVSTVKASLVAAIFMHLKYMGGAPRLTFLLSVGFVILLIAGILGDVFTRFPLTNPNESELSGVAERNFEARQSYGPIPAPEVAPGH